MTATKRVLQVAGLAAGVVGAIRGEYAGHTGGARRAAVESSPRT